MDRRGLLLAEETLKIIIALIAIGFLVYFLTSLYFANVNTQKKQHAAASLERIADVIRNIQNEAENITDITPPGWYLFSFTDEEKPNLCSGINCLCICDNVFLGIGNQAKKCDKKGVCEIVEDLEYFEKIKIKSPGISIEVLKSGNKIIVREK